MEGPEIGESHTPPQARWSPTDTLLLAFAAPFVYAASYLFEVGYHSYFKIPAELISVSVEEALTAFSVLSLYGLVIIFFLNLRMRVIASERLRFLRVATTPVIFFFLMLSVTGGHGTIFWGTTAAFSMMLLGDYGIPAITRRSGESYRESVARSHRQDVAYAEKGLFGAVTSKVTDFGIISALIVFTVMPFSYLAGQAYASRSGNFGVSGDKSNLVALARYGDLIVFAERSSDPHRLRARFHLLSGDHLLLVSTQLGPFLETEQEVVDQPVAHRIAPNPLPKKLPLPKKGSPPSRPQR